MCNSGACYKVSSVELDDVHLSVDQDELCSVSFIKTVVLCSLGALCVLYKLQAVVVMHHHLLLIQIKQQNMMFL